MNNSDLYKGMNGISDEILERSEKSIKKQGNFPAKWGLIAAAILLAAIAISLILIFKNIDKESKSTDDIANVEKTANNENIKNNDKITNTEKIDNNATENKINNEILLADHKVMVAEYPAQLMRPKMEDYENENGELDFHKYIEALEKWESDLNELYSQNRDENETKILENSRAALWSFTKKSLGAFLDSENHENRIFSPLNIYMAMGLLAESSAGNTREQILGALGINSIEELRAMIKNTVKQIYKDDGAAKTIPASSIWLRDDMEYNTDTLESLAKNYYTSSFTGKMGTEEYSNAFRAWLNEQTDNLLTDKVDNLELDGSVVVALASTLLFSAKWNDSFDPEQTRKDVFHAADGDIECDFMNRNIDALTYYWGDHFGAVNMYLGGSDNYMMLILPDEGYDINELLEDEQVQSFIEDSQHYAQNKALQVNISLPKFDVASSLDISEALMKLGVTDAFDDRVADFSPLFKNGENICIDKAEHGVRVIADEEGVKATSYMVFLGYGAAFFEEKMDFVIDRPFIFVINNNYGPLYIGVVEKP